MTQRDKQLDAALRELGATYYATLHGSGSAGDVDRALEAVDDHAGPDSGPSSRPPGPSATGRPPGHLRGRWRVRDVMTTKVVTVSPQTTCKHTASLLHDNQVSAAPVLTPDGQVAGVVSEADLLPARHRRPRHRPQFLPGRPARADARTVAETMTVPAITIGPDATVVAAARLMDRHHLNLLPVVGADGQLVGSVSRRDLLRVFLRPDEQIAADAAGVLAGILLLEPPSVTVTVDEGVATLSGTVRTDDQIRAAIKLVGDVDGVVAVNSELTSRQADTWTRPPG